MATGAAAQGHPMSMGYGNATQSKGDKFIQKSSETRAKQHLGLSQSQRQPPATTTTTFDDDDGNDDGGHRLAPLQQERPQQQE